VSTKGLTMSFEPLNSSLPLSAAELRVRKATCDPWHKNPRNQLYVKVLRWHYV